MSRNDSHIDINAPVYNLKAVVNETGLKPPTLRAWERRYGFPNPTRTKGGHRKYSQHDIDTLRWLVARQDEGMSISHAIDLWRSLKDAGEDPTADAIAGERQLSVSSSFALGEHQQLDALRQAWIQAVLAFDRGTAENVLTRAFALYPPELVSLQILDSGLVEIGEGWFRGEVTVQQEHFASALSVQRVEMLIASMPPPSRPESIIVATAEGDFHTFGALVLTFLLRRQGWNVIYLGASMPALALKDMVDRVQPHLVILTAQLFHTVASLKEAAMLLQSLRIKLAFGGTAFSQIVEPQQFIPGHFLGHTLEEAVQKVPSIIDRPQIAARPDTLRNPLSDAAERFAERRALIDAHVWDTFTTAGLATDHLVDISNDFAQSVGAALNLGDLDLLGTDINGISALLMSHRQPLELINEYLKSYRLAARIHLGESGRAIVDWLTSLVAD